MFILVQAHEYYKYSILIEKMFRLRKKIFADQLQWDVRVIGEYECDEYDALKPAYLVWCSDNAKTLYGATRLMPTTGPTLLCDVFRRTFPENLDIAAPGIWEATRTCVDDEALAASFPEVEPTRAFCLILLALCECGLAHGIHTMVSNYEPCMKRIYRRSGAQIKELGRADGYGKLPVCCGSFEISERIFTAMRTKLKVDLPIYHKVKPSYPLTSALQSTS